MKPPLFLTLNRPGVEAALRLAGHLDSDKGNGTLFLYYKEGTPLPPELTEAKNREEYANSSETNSHEEDQNRKPAPDVQLRSYSSLDSLLKELWQAGNSLLCFMATGIVVRKIAPLLRSKWSDPAVVVADFRLSFFIPLVSGHAGGANELAQELASRVKGSLAAITTATDQTDHFAADLFAKRNGFLLENPEMVAPFTGALLNGQTLEIFAPSPLHELISREPGFRADRLLLRDPEQYGERSGEKKASPPAEERELPAMFLSASPPPHDGILRIRLRPLRVGCGLNRGVPAEEIHRAFRTFLKEHGLRRADVEGVASLEEKSDEEGLLRFAREESLPLAFYSRERINSLEGEFSPSRATEFFGIKGVAEPCALLDGGGRVLLVRKHVYGGVTLAAALALSSHQES